MVLLKETTPRQNLTETQQVFISELPEMNGFTLGEQQVLRGLLLSLARLT